MVVFAGRRSLFGGLTVLFKHFISFLEMGTVSRSGYRVSAKIQQLLNTLKRPKRRHLEEFYEDDDVELEMAANPKDPNAPSPEGSTMMPAAGPQLVRPFKMSNKQKK
jgi:hypothetical protein